MAPTWEAFIELEIISNLSLHSECTHIQAMRLFPSNVLLSLSSSRFLLYYVTKDKELDNV